MNATLLAAAEEAAGHPELPMEPIFYGLITLSIFITMAIVVRSWKGIPYRH